MAAPTVIDLFAGAGLFSYAFKKVGFELIQAVETDCTAGKTYAANLGDHLQLADASKVRPICRADVIIAGPPCQGFSTLGAQDPKDPRNRLALKVVDWAIMVKPKVVVIENVAPFLDSATFTRMSNRFTDLGYSVTSYVLDAIDFGVAQHRKRAFVIASRIGAAPNPPAGKSRTQTVRDAWEGLPVRANGKNFHYAPSPSPLALARMKQIPAGGDKRDIMYRAPKLAAPSWWNVRGEVTDAWGRMDWGKPANTLRTCLQNASKGRYIHPSQNRVISLREAARLHSIPDGWKFFGMPTQIARQIGNSVPPLMGKAVAKSVLTLL